SLLQFEIINKIDDFNLSEESSEFVKELFDIKILQSVNELYEPIIQRKINSFELQMFKIESYEKMLSIGHRLRIKNKIFTSIEYSKLTKNKSSGIIKYSVENNVHFAVSQYEIITNNQMSSNKIRVPKELNYLKEEDFFVIFFIVILIGSFKKEFLRKARCIPIESYRFLSLIIKKPVRTP
ncbi:hypothetical protein BpHYR1_003315, partial [Brachionus plicatilis]